MKIKRVTILDENQKQVYKGKLIGLSYEKKAIIDTCIELFDDDSPCIIHESYAIQTLADHVEKALLDINEKNIQITDAYLEKLPMLNQTYLNHTFEIEVKK